GYFRKRFGAFDFVSVLSGRCRKIKPQLGMRRGISQFVEQIILQSTLGGGINCTLNRVLQISWESRDMRIVNAGIGGKLIAGQFAAFPGTVEWMPQDRSLANQIIQ